MNHTYIGSDGTEKDVRTMPEPYLKNAERKMAKLLREKRADHPDYRMWQMNIEAIEQEIARRSMETR